MSNKVFSKIDSVRPGKSKNSIFRKAKRDLHEAWSKAKNAPKEDIKLRQRKNVALIRAFNNGQVYQEELQGIDIRAGEIYLWGKLVARNMGTHTYIGAGKIPYLSSRLIELLNLLEGIQIEQYKGTTYLNGKPYRGQYVIVNKHFGDWEENKN